jgi:hypothetical protein
MIHWLKVLGDGVKITANDASIVATWTGGEILCGVLPADTGEAIDFGPLHKQCTSAPYTQYPAALPALLDEAGIFSDDVVLEVAALVGGDRLCLSTVGPISWHREVVWAAPSSKPMAVPLKRLRTALDYTQKLALQDGRIHLSSDNSDLFIVIATK